MFDKTPDRALKLAVKRMLPHGPLAKKQLTKLKFIKAQNIHMLFKTQQLLNYLN